MLLTEKQKMALSEFMRMVLSMRTATALSELIGSDVKMTVAGVSLSPLSKLTLGFPQHFNEDIVSVHQVFKGSISGDALFLLNYSCAVQLTNLLQQNNQNQIVYLNISSCEVLTEAGNILLNSYIGLLGSLMGCQFTFSMPVFQVEPLPDLVKSLMLGRNEVRYFLMVDTTFEFCHNSVRGYLVFVSGVIPLSCLIKGIEASIDLTLINP